MLHHTWNLHALWRTGVTLLRLGLGGLFIAAGLAKIQQPYDFLGAVYDYELAGPRTGLWIASILPWLEVGVGLSLVSGVWQTGGALLAVVLFSVFTVAQASAAAEGLKIPCGCAAGNAPVYTSYWKVAESAAMLVGACLVLVGSLALDLARASGPAEQHGDVPSSSKYNPASLAP
jgi:putative oxidoreductase